MFLSYVTNVLVTKHVERHVCVQLSAKRLQKDDISSQKDIASQIDNKFLVNELNQIEGLSGQTNGELNDFLIDSYVRPGRKENLPLNLK